MKADHRARARRRRSEHTGVPKDKLYINNNVFKLSPTCMVCVSELGRGDNEEDSPTLNLPIWPLDDALDKGRQGKTS
jgi:hypothetical protein